MGQEILPSFPAVTENEAEPAIDPDDLPEDLAFTPAEQRTKRWTGITAQKQRMPGSPLARASRRSSHTHISGCRC